ncbi:MAG: photosystem II protein Psb27 [Cyanobacteria bacterium J06632_22]
MNRILSRLLAFALVAVIGLTGCSGSGVGADGLSGVYRDDTVAVIDSLRTAINLPKDAPTLGEAQADAKDKINAFAARYRRGSAASLGSFATMRTALNALAGHYSSYPNRPVPEKLRNRLEQEFKQVEMALKREA